MANVVTNEFVEKCNNELKVFNALSLHEKVSYYLQKMEFFATYMQEMLQNVDDVMLREEDEAMNYFVENFFDEISMLEDNDLPSVSPFDISEQELKDNYEVIFDTIREVRRGFCYILNDMNCYWVDNPYEPSVMEVLNQMKDFSIVDRALILEIDELED